VTLFNYSKRAPGFDMNRRGWPARGASQSGAGHDRGAKELHTWTGA